MSRFLFVTWNGGGNVPPMFEIARVVRDRGHEVELVGTELGTPPGYATLGARCQDRGLPFRPFALSSGRFDDDGPGRGILTGVFASHDHAEDLAQAMAAGDHDAVVIDGLMFGAIAAAEADGLPAGVMVPGSPGAFAAPQGPFEEMLLPAVNDVRVGRGLAALPRLLDAWATLPTVCESLRELDPVVDAAPPSLRYLGPVFESAPPSGWSSPWAADDERPLVLVSFTTNPAWDQTSRIERAIEALGGGDYRVLVTSSLASVGHLADDRNVAVIDHVPHSEVLPHASAAVGHAGHGTIAMPLAFGVPVVSLPNPIADQPPLAHQTAAIGAGIALDGELATAADIRGAVARVVEDPRYRERARALSRTIAAARAAEAAADWVETLAR